MKVIQYADPTGQTIVARVPKQGTAAIKIGSQLIVEESQRRSLLTDSNQRIWTWTCRSRYIFQSPVVVQGENDFTCSFDAYGSGGSYVADPQ